jgi:hypothetical protein
MGCTGWVRSRVWCQRRRSARRASTFSDGSPHADDDQNSRADEVAYRKEASRASALSRRASSSFAARSLSRRPGAASTRSHWAEYEEMASTVVQCPGPAWSWPARDAVGGIEQHRSPEADDSSRAVSRVDLERGFGGGLRPDDPRMCRRAHDVRHVGMRRPAGRDHDRAVVPGLMVTPTSGRPSNDGCYRSRATQSPP